MSGQQRLPLEIDPFLMAEMGRRFIGDVELSVFKRVLPLLESTSGNVDIELVFGIDEGGISYLNGKLKTMLVLSCQRCLTAMDFPVQNEFRLAIVRNNCEAEQLPEHYEPVIVETTPMHMMDMIEDEILLSIPHIPMHDEALCLIKPFSDKDNLAEQQKEVRPNPFAVLEKLKKDH